jgi:2Fe-2S ferredoxin
MVTDRAGVERSFDAQLGRSLMENICDAGLDELLAVCGGSCSCGTCHIYVDEGWELLAPISAPESDLLDGSEHRRHTSRLSCQIEVTDRLAGLRVTIAPGD